MVAVTTQPQQHARAQGALMPAVMLGQYPLDAQQAILVLCVCNIVIAGRLDSLTPVCVIVYAIMIINKKRTPYVR